jgi:hypothetical protein
MKHRLSVSLHVLYKRVKVTTAGDAHTQVITVVPPLPENRTKPKAASDSKQHDLSQLKLHRMDPRRQVHYRKISNLHVWAANSHPARVTRRD